MNCCSMYEGGKERGTAICKTQKALSWLGAGFQPVELGILSKLMELWM